MARPNINVHPKGLFVQVEPELKEAIEKYCEDNKCTIREFVENGARILISSRGEEMVRLFVKGKAYTVPLSLAKIYETAMDRK
jgi:hypothetical protein